MPSVPPPKEKALIVGIARSPSGRWDEAERLEELAGLVTGCGAEVFETLLQIRERPDPAFYIGQGKAQEIAGIVAEFGLDIVVFDAPLSGSQTRNLEKIIKARVVDRTEVIMDIFAQHASTPEARVQVELAQLRYQASKLRGMWSHLDRAGGGIGTRGPGEKQLETDKRKINQEIDRLKKRLWNIERSKAVQRTRRKKEFRVSLVGYTNAGKSSVMNLLTEAGQPADDVPFTTLDPVTRRLRFPGVAVSVLLTDTVGFIEDLPPDLIASFKATLDVVREADLLLHIVDASWPLYERRIEAVERTLEGMGCGDLRRILVFNKCDLLLSDEAEERLLDKHEGAILLSARTGNGAGRLRDAMVEAFRETMVKFRVRLETGDMGELYPRIVSGGILTMEEYDEQGVVLEGYLPKRLEGLVAGRNER